MLTTNHFNFAGYAPVSLVSLQVGLKRLKWSLKIDSNKEVKPA